MKIELSNSIWIALRSLTVLGVTVLLFSAVRYKIDRQIGAVDIVIENEDKTHLIDIPYFKSIVSEKFGETLTNVSLEYINIKEMEVFLNDNPYIESAEVFIDKNNKLLIRIFEKEPVLRVFDNRTRGYYLDKKGDQIPLSKAFTARLPVVVNSVDQLADSLVRVEMVAFANGIKKRKFSNALIDQISINTNGEIEAVPALGKERILFGSIKDLEDKLKRLEIFYSENIGQGQWDRCQVIDVRFKGQIVCQKRT